MKEKGIPQDKIYFFHSNGFVEGWALYVESLGDYTKEELFGKFVFEMLRAVRLVVDVGIHYYGWSFEKALTYMKKHLYMTESEIKTELIRYICNPGQAVSYKMGERVFFELRDLYKDHNIKDFHQDVLSQGILPLDLLKKNLYKKHRVSR